MQSFITKLLAVLPRAQLAGIARQVLAALALEAEGATTNQILHDGEVVGFGELDALLAKVAASGAGS
jgi:predicted oxidoreductase